MKSNLFCILMHILNVLVARDGRFFLIGIIIRTVLAAQVLIPLLQVREGHADAAQVKILESWLMRRCCINSSGRGRTF